MNADRTRPKLVDHLLTLPPYEPDSPEKDALFNAALAESIQEHAGGNELYAAFLRKKEFDPLSMQDDLGTVPYLPVQIFKALGTQLRVVPEEQIHLALSSSATSGQPSTVLVDQLTAKRQARCMSKVLSACIGSTRRPFLILDVDSSGFGVTRNARSAAVRAYLTFASQAHYLMVEGQTGLALNEEMLQKIIAELSPKIPVVLFGFTYILYGAVVRRALTTGQSFSLPSGSIVLHIGGWKKLEAEKISRKLFTSHVAEIFGVTGENIIDVYGFTEQMGLNYPDCRCGWKHTPAASRVLVRDPVNHAVLKPEQTGVLEFLTPLPHSYPGTAVLTDDVGVITHTPCPYGRGGTRFKVLGRLQKAEPRGCGDILGEKIRTRENQDISDSSIGQPTIVAWGTQQTLTNIADLTAYVCKAKEWLAAQPSEALMGLIYSTAQTWLTNPAFDAWKHHGLVFLVRWCSADNLRALATQALRGLPECLDTFKPEQQRKRHYLRALPRGQVVHWLSGNVPLLGMLVLVQSIVTKNVNILKAASNNVEILSQLISTFAGRKFTTEEGYTVYGDDFLRSVALVHYPHTDFASASALSLSADVRIAWGGREAIDAVCSLPARVECSDIVFGPKTSFMVIAREAIADEQQLKKILRRTATDVSSFDQTACSSPHTIFVEYGGIVTPEEFAERLGSFMENAAVLIPKAPEDEATAASVCTARVVGDFLGRCWHGEGWTVLYDERMELASPIYSRTITVRPVTDILEAATMVHAGIQTIGLAAQGEKRFRFAEAAAARGAFRFPEIGVMTAFDSPWDGEFVMDRLVRWVTLGGAGLPLISKEISPNLSISATEG